MLTMRPVLPLMGLLLISATLRTAADPLPAPWKSQDIGHVGVPGSVSFAKGVWTVQASGEDIFGPADSFRFVYLPLKGDGEITARVVQYQRRDMWTKVGVMVRESLDPGARFADILVTPDKGGEFQWRTQTGGATDTSDQTPSPTPYWVRLTRKGDLITGFLSKDGATWEERGHETIKMASDALVGLCVTSHKNDQLTEAQIDSVLVDPPPASPRSSAAAPKKRAIPQKSGITKPTKRRAG